MVIHLSLADLIILVGLSALVGFALGMVVWRPGRRERAVIKQALEIQEQARYRARQRIDAAAREEDRIDAEDRARSRAAFYAPFESVAIVDPKERRRG